MASTGGWSCRCDNKCLGSGWANFREACTRCHFAVVVEWEKLGFSVGEVPRMGAE